MQEKQLKYASLVANAVKLSNVADLTEVLSAMSKKGHPVTQPWSLLHHSAYESRFADLAGSLPTWTTCPTLKPQPLSFETAL